MELKGSVALVTGGSGGLGRHVCEALAKSGAASAVGYLNGLERAEEVCERIAAGGGTAVPYKIDQADEGSISEAIASVVQDLGSLDILINNAAMAKGVPFPDLAGLSSELWDTTMQVNLRGPWLVAKHASLYLKTSHWR